MGNKYTLLDFRCENDNCPVEQHEELVTQEELEQGVPCPECGIPMKKATFCSQAYGRHGSWAMWRLDQDWGNDQ